MLAEPWDDEAQTTVDMFLARREHYRAPGTGLPLVADLVTKNDQFGRESAAATG